MKQQVFVIHGGDAFDTYEEYLANLKEITIDFERAKKKGWKDSLAEMLSNEYEVIQPQMPNKMNAKYLEWKIWFEKFLPILKDNIIFIGHSLGGIFLSKYLSESSLPIKIKATILVAAPFNSPTDHPLADFVLENNLERFSEQGGTITLYHSKDDKVVPFSNYESYQKILFQAQSRIYEDKGHFNKETFPELIEDIKKL